jgi:hypothetical protein
MSKDSKRSFTLVHVATNKGKVKGAENLGGRYMSHTPSGAARKAGTQVCRASNIKGQCSLVVTVRETTSGSSKKEFKYKVTRVKDPVTVERDGQMVTYNYKTVVKSMK